MTNPNSSSPQSVEVEPIPNYIISITQPSFTSDLFDFADSDTNDRPKEPDRECTWRLLFVSPPTRSALGDWGHKPFISVRDLISLGRQYPFDTGAEGRFRLIMTPTEAVSGFMVFQVVRLGKEERERGGGMGVEQLLDGLESDDLIA